MGPAAESPRGGENGPSPRDGLAKPLNSKRKEGAARKPSARKDGVVPSHRRTPSDAAGKKGGASKKA